MSNDLSTIRTLTAYARRLRADAGSETAAANAATLTQAAEVLAALLVDASERDVDAARDEYSYQRSHGDERSADAAREEIRDRLGRQQSLIDALKKQGLTLTVEV